MYNTTSIEQANNLVEIFSAFNSSFSDWFFTIVYFVLFLLIIIVMYKSDLQETLIGTSMVMVLIGILLWAMELMDGGFVFIPGFIGLATIIKKLLVQ